MIARATALALALVAATGAAALTCAPPDPLRAFRAAQDSPDRYVVLHGRLSFDPARMPPDGYVPPLDGSGGDAPQPPAVPARFEGQVLSGDGFTIPLSTPITLQPTCIGPWCAGGIAPGTWLLFARQTPAGYEVEIGPCGGWAFDRVSDAVLDTLAACLRGEACGTP